MAFLYLIGSYNGIVCVATINRFARYWSKYRNPVNIACGIVDTRSLTLQIYLWNPATKKSKLLPPPHCLVTKFSFEYVGFGFDPLVNDYKVVRLRDHLNNKDIYARAYSANMNAWKEIECPKIGPHRSICDAYDHKLPADVLRTGEGNCLCVRIMEMKDSIVVITGTYDRARIQSKVNLWTVDDGFESSWTLRYSFDVAS